MLAESWVIEGDSVTFTLREGVIFYPSRNPLTAEDVKWSMVRNHSVEGSVTRFNANLAGIFDPESQIEVLDERRVRFSFTDAEGNPRINPVSLTSLKFNAFSIIDSVEAEKHATPADPLAEEYLRDNALGTGAYFVSSRTPGVETVFDYVGDDYYWREAPHFKRVIARVFENPADIVALMSRGDVDGAKDLGIPEVSALEDEGLQSLFGNIPWIVRLNYAVDHPALANKDVRQALSHAIPYQQIIDGVFDGRATRAFSYLNPLSPGFKPSWEPYDFDLDVARNLLEESGQGEFDLTIFYDSGIATNEDVALVVEDTWRGLGINVRTEGLPSAAFADARLQRLTALNEGRATARLLQGVILTGTAIWLDDPDANTDLFVKTKGFRNTSGYSNPAIDELHAKWRFETEDLSGRASAYEEVQDMAAEDAHQAPVAVTGLNVVLQPGIRGFMFTADPHVRWYHLTFE